QLFDLQIRFAVVYTPPRHSTMHRSDVKRLALRLRAVLCQKLSTQAAVEEQITDLDGARMLLREKVDSFVVQLQDVLPLNVLNKHHAYRFWRQLLNYSPHKADVNLKYDTFVDFFACDSALECHRDHLRLDDNDVRVLSLKEPPAQTFPNLLGGLL